MVEDSRGKIFISYRRDDTQHVAGRLSDRLQQHFDVFMDVESMDPGVDVDTAIDTAVSGTDVLLVLIGRTWLNSLDDDGNRRLDDPNDYVVREVAGALERATRVIPVLVDGAEMPERKDLPPRIAK